MNIMIVEDDFFKYSKIEKLVKETIADVDIVVFENIHGVVNYLASKSPDKIILDMSLPSHTAKVGEGTPLPMPTGGIEVILELRALNKNNIPIIILTQYPDIEIEDDYYSISEAGLIIEQLYEMNDIDVAHYQNDDRLDGGLNEWVLKTLDFLRK